MNKTWDCKNPKPLHLPIGFDPFSFQEVIEIYFVEKVFAIIVLLSSY
jgi:hypothetical protein